MVESTTEAINPPNWEALANKQIVELEEFPELTPIDTSNFEVNELRDTLEKYGALGEEMKTADLNSLLEEIQNRERQLVTYHSKDGQEKLAFKMQIVSADVTCTPNNAPKQRLKEKWYSKISIVTSGNEEDPEVVDNPSINYQERNKPRALTEKMKVDEQRDEGTKRAVKEELKITDENAFTVSNIRTTKEARFSSTYNILSFTEVHIADIDLKPNDQGELPFKYREEAEQQTAKEDKTNTTTHTTKMIRLEWVTADESENKAA